ncbi:MAG: ABC transporter permease [Thermoanaerobaculia bacterium]
MIRHLFRLVWNRKRANALVVLEIFFSFLVVFGVLLLGVSTVHNLSRPVGFSSTNVWNVEFGIQEGSDSSAQSQEMAARLIQVVKGLDPVESVAATMIVPYAMSSMNDQATVNGRRVSFDFSNVTDDFGTVLKLDLVAGRWFGKEDDGAKDRPVIVSRDFAREMFGSGDPIGREIPEDRSRPGAETEPQQTRRIIGVLASYRVKGELSSDTNTALYRADLSNPKERTPHNLIIRVRPGTPRTFEETLVKTLQATARDYRFTVEPLSEMKEAYKKRNLIPIGIAALVATFLMLMVALGLTGVLWQNVTKRTKEIGLRRATGATARQISFQILAEIWILTTLALVLGSALVLQLPLLNMLSFVTTPLYVLSFALSLVTLFALSSLCAFYPSWLATRISPTEALRHE